MPYISANSEAIGADADGELQGGVKQAQDEADGTLKGSFKAQGTMTETVIVVGSYAATNSSLNQGAQQAANK